MGLFSSSYKYFAYAGSEPLFDVLERPDTWKSVLVQTALGGERTITEALLYTINTDLGARAKKMISYGDRAYSRGLPTTNQKKITVPEATIIATISGIIGTPIFIIRFVLGGAASEPFIISKAIKDNYLNPTYFNWPLANPLNPIWDEQSVTVEIPVVNTDTGLYYEAANPPQFRRNLGTSHYQISYDYIDKDALPQTWDSPALIDLTAYDNKEWVQVKYSATPTPTEIDYWEYEIGSNIIPAFEAAIVTATRDATFMPVAILIHDKVWYDSVDQSPLHLTTNRLLKKLNIDGAQIKSDFLAQEILDDAEADANKSNAEKWDFFIHFSCPVHSNVHGSMEYLYHFFKEMQINSTHDLSDYQAYLASRIGSAYTLSQPFSELTITEGDVNGFNVKYGWSYIYIKTFTGQFIDGTPLLPRRMHSVFYDRGDTDVVYKVGLEEIHGTGTPLGVDGPDEDDGFHDYVIYTRQHQDVNGVLSYTRVLIMGLSMEYIINTETSAGADFRFRSSEPALHGDQEETDEFRIPIHIGVLKEVSILHREEMLADSLVGTVFLVERLKVKWYQKGFFKWLIIVIAVILVVLSVIYPGFLGQAVQLFSAAFGATSATVLYLVHTVLQFAIAFIISTAGQLIGGDLGMIFAAIGMLIVINMGIRGLSNPFGIQSIGQAGSGWGNAVNLVQSISPYLRLGLELRNNAVLAALEAEMREFVKDSRERQQELQDAWDTLGMPSWLDPLDLVNMYRRLGPVESADSYYARVLNTNPGRIGYDLVYRFPELALQLPDEFENVNIVESMLQDLAIQRGAA